MFYEFRLSCLNSETLLKNHVNNGIQVIILMIILALYIGTACIHIDVICAIINS